MKKFRVLLSVMLIQLMVVGVSCAQKGHNEEHGEEDGTQFKKSQTYDEVKKGVRLVLKYNEASSEFVGVITNKSEEVVERARVEVHLSNGVELGPTKPKDVKAGEKLEVTLSAKGQKFETWSTHAEVGSNEHGHGEGGEGHEDGEGHEHNEKGEHGSKKEGKGEHGEREGGEHR